MSLYFYVIFEAKNCNRKLTLVITRFVARLYDLVWWNTFSGGKVFIFIIYVKQCFLGTAQKIFGGRCPRTPLRGYGPGYNLYFTHLGNSIYFCCGFRRVAVATVFRVKHVFVRDRFRRGKNEAFEKDKLYRGINYIFASILNTTTKTSELYMKKRWTQ